MNVQLLNSYRQLPAEERTALKNRVLHSPVMNRLLEFLDAQQGKGFSSAEAVQHLYKIKTAHKDYAIYKNRYYKLRRKLYDSLDEPENPTRVPEEQQWLQKAGTMLSTGKFNEAEALLNKTERQCRRNNIFELLPEVTDMLIQTYQALNTIEKNKALHPKFREALRLYNDLMEAKNLARQVYEANLRSGLKETLPLYKRLAKLVVKNRRFPRFKLIYNFVAGYYKTGAGGPEYLHLTHVPNRHIAAAKKILQQCPDMPALHYLPGYRANQIYRLSELLGMSFYNALRFKEAAAEIKPLYDQVMQENSAYGRMKNEVLFSNTIHVLAAAEYFEEALKVAEDFIVFVKENKQYERMRVVYYEIGSLHAAMYPRKSKYSTAFLLERAEELLRYRTLANEPNDGYAALLLKIKLLCVQQEWEAALKLLQQHRQKKVFSSPAVQKMAHQTLQCLKQNAPEELSALRTNLKRARINATTTSAYSQLRFLERLLTAAL